MSQPQDPDRPKSRFYGMRIALVMLAAALLFGFIQWNRARDLRQQLESARHPAEAHLTLRGEGLRGGYRLRQLRGPGFYEGDEPSWELIEESPSDTVNSIHLPAGIIELTWGEQSWPLLLPRGGKLDIDLTPAPKGFCRVPPGPYLGRLDSRLSRPLNPEGKTHGPSGYLISEREVSLADYGEFLRALAVARNQNDGEAIAPRDHALEFGPYCSEFERKHFKKGCRGHRPVGGQMDLWAKDIKDGIPDKILRFVNYFDALAYCEFLTLREQNRGRLVRYRLPTQSEWEKAARGVDGRPFPWGFSPISAARRGEGDVNLRVSSHAALRSPYGLFHMGSGVSEWTSTPEGRLRRVVAGVSFDLHRDEIYLGYGLGESPWMRSPALGFRVVREERDDAK
ncbi:MAG: SUMF1/EgtB/PvdO family nonheme iron enzyme [Planctomycetota bacterium]